MFASDGDFRACKSYRKSTNKFCDNFASRAKSSLVRNGINKGISKPLKSLSRQTIKSDLSRSPQKTKSNKSIRLQSATMIRKDPQRMKKLYFKCHRQTTCGAREKEIPFEIHVYPNLIFFIRRRGDDRQL